MFIPLFFLISSFAYSKSNIFCLLYGLLICWISNLLERWKAGFPDSPPLLHFLVHILPPIELHTPPSKRRVLGYILSLVIRQSKSFLYTSRIRQVWVRTFHQSFGRFEPRTRFPFCRSNPLLFPAFRLYDLLYATLYAIVQIYSY